MRLNWKQMMVSVAVFTLFGTGSIFASPPDSSPSPPGEGHVVTYLSERASTLLAEIQKETTELRRHADTLDTFARAPHYSWRSHAEYLHSVKDHINAIGKRIGELQDMRHAVLPWQQAISEITPSAAQVAASTQAAILYLRENQNRLFVEEYRNHLTTIADNAENMKQTVDKFLDYERTQQKLERLKGELEIGGA